MGRMNISDILVMAQKKSPVFSEKIGGCGCSLIEKGAAWEGIFLTGVAVVEFAEAVAEVGAVAVEDDVALAVGEFTSGEFLD